MRECVIEWRNNISETIISRTIPFLYESDSRLAESFLAQGFVVIISEFSDIAFASPYSNRSLAMAKPGETLVYPCGQVLTLRSIAE